MKTNEELFNLLSSEDRKVAAKARKELDVRIKSCHDLLPGDGFGPWERK